MEGQEIVTERQRGLGVKFNRIRRITGYLVYSLDTWNSAKLAELHDRTMHTMITDKK
jgi:ribonucleoside-triphosphate reductase